MNQNDIFQNRKNLYLEMSQATRGALVLFGLLGIATLVAGFYLGYEKRTWGSFLFNLLFFYSLSLGGVAFGSMQDVIGALWGRPIKRLHESFYAFLPIGSLALFAFLLSLKFEFLNAHEMYVWMADPHFLDHFPGKSTWLDRDFMIIRDIVSLCLILGLARWHVLQGVRRDLALVDGRKDEAFKLGAYAKEKLRFWAAPIMVTYALSFSVLCFDLTMSLAPTWFSTLWAGWNFAMMMHILMAFMLILMFSIRSTQVGQFIQRQQFHDIGKLLHGFTVFFAYLTFAHVLTYWYTNMPEETSYFITRLERPWLYFIIAAPFLVFFFPFFMLIPKANKWTPSITIPICVVVILAQWLNSMLVVIPEVTSGAEWEFPWIELGGFLGFLSLFLACFYRFAKRVPMIAIADPLLISALQDAHH